MKLETARITYLNGIEVHEIKPEKVRKMLDDVGNQITIQDEKVNRIIKHTDDAYSNFIAILGIFLAIVNETDLLNLMLKCNMTKKVEINI